MEGRKQEDASEKNAVRPVLPAAGSDAATVATRTQPPALLTKTPLLPDAGAPAQQVDADEAAQDDEVVDDSAAGQEEEDDDEEQVERFYALLANIRAMRGLPPYSGAGGGSGSGPSRKRTRHAEPPWRPAFRMEDFEEDPTQPPVARSKRQAQARGGAEADGESGARPAAVAVVPSSSSSPPHAVVRPDGRAANKD